MFDTIRWSQWEWHVPGSCPSTVCHEYRTSQQLDRSLIWLIRTVGTNTKHFPTTWIFFKGDNYHGRTSNQYKQPNKNNITYSPHGWFEGSASHGRLEKKKGHIPAVRTSSAFSTFLSCKCSTWPMRQALGEARLSSFVIEGTPPKFNSEWTPLKKKVVGRMLEDEYLPIGFG